MSSNVRPSERKTGKTLEQGRNVQGRANRALFIKFMNEVYHFK